MARLQSERQPQVGQAAPLPEAQVLLLLLLQPGALAMTQPSQKACAQELSCLLDPARPFLAVLTLQAAP